MKLYLIRHGQTVTSGKTYAGRSDVALTAAGLAEAEAIAARLADRPIVLIATSPLGRAANTANPLARRRGLRPILMPALSELDFGTYEGQAKAALGLKLRKAHARTPVPDGESLSDVWSRAGQVLSEIEPLDLHAASEIALVGHYWIKRTVFGRITGLNFDETCRSKINRPRTGTVRTINCDLGCAPFPIGEAREFPE